MAFTPDQQYLADTVSLNKSVGDNEQCCLSLGGVVDFLNESCELPQYDTSINLSEMCSVAQSLAEQQPDAGEQNGSGSNINWGGIGEFINEFAETALPVFFPSQQPPATIGGAGTTPGGNGNTPPLDDKKGISTKGIVAIVVTVLTLAVAVYFIRKR
jgi:hypothetical protein